MSSEVRSDAFQTFTLDDHHAEDARIMGSIQFSSRLADRSSEVLKDLPSILRGSLRDEGTATHKTSCPHRPQG